MEVSAGSISLEGDGSIHVQNLRFISAPKNSLWGACVQSIIMDLVKAVLGKRARHHRLHKQGTVSGPPWSARGDGYTVIMDEGCADLCHTERPLQTQQAGHDRKVRKPDTLH